MTTYEQYVDGFMSPMQALRALVMELGEVESELAPLEEQRAQLREQISDVVSRLDGQRAEIKGFGRVLITSPSVSEAYDTKALDALLGRLRDEGRHEEADVLLACKGKRMRSGGLRIEREQKLR